MQFPPPRPQAALSASDLPLRHLGVLEYLGPAEHIVYVKAYNRVYKLALATPVTQTVAGLKRLLEVRNTASHGCAGWSPLHQSRVTGALFRLMLPETH